MALEALVCHRRAEARSMVAVAAVAGGIARC